MYQGQYLHDKKHGFGIYRWNNGNLYIGEYENNERNGIGEMNWIDDSTYIGQWKQGLQHGYGRMKLSNGTINEGMFKNGDYIGPIDQSLIPEILSTPNLDIMALIPRNLPFNEIVLNYCLNRRRSKANLNTLKEIMQNKIRMKSKNNRRIIKRSISANQNFNLKRIVRSSRGKHIASKDFSLADRKNHSSGCISSGSNPISRLKRISMIKRRVWIPVGRVFHNDSMPSILFKTSFCQ